MAESKNSEKENPYIFLAVILSTLGVVGYKWYQEHNIQLIILDNIP
jgi:predicted negative regulator of RcsB-dependent stress response